MGGDFGRGGSIGMARAEHNLSSDVTAAAATFAAGVPITVVGLDQTTRVRVGGDMVAQLEASGPFGRLLAAEIQQYWTFTQESSNVPHDPIAVLLLTDPDLFSFTTGRIEVDADGHSTFRPGATGPHRVVTDLDQVRVAGLIASRLVAATRER
jgi:purine nucleosidase